LSNVARFEIANDDQRRNITIYNLKNAKISLIGYNDLNEVNWNESFDKLTKYIENEINWRM